MFAHLYNKAYSVFSFSPMKKMERFGGPKSTIRIVFLVELGLIRQLGQECRQNKHSIKTFETCDYLL